MKMTEFRSKQPLRDDDFVAIRRNVMNTIAARNERRLFPIVMRFAIAAAVIIAIGLAFVHHRPSPATVVVKPHAPIIETVHAAPAPIAAPVAQPRAVRVAHRPRHRLAPHPEYQNIRLEFRTSDPDVRIIWIASQTPQTTGGKS